MSKVCKKCYQEKDISLFRSKRNSCRACDTAYTMAYDRLHDTKERRSRKKAYSITYYAAHRTKAIARAKAWVTANPEQAKQTSHAYYIKHKDTWNDGQNKDKINARRRELRTIPANKARKSAQNKSYRAKNTASIRAHQKQYYKAHSEEIKAKVSAWNKTHPQERRNQDILRKARQQGANRTTLSEAQWREIKDAFDHRCAYCGRKMQRLTREHITPVNNHGDHHVHNIVPACQSCNSSKGIKPPPVPVQPLLLTIAPEHKKRIS